MSCTDDLEPLELRRGATLPQWDQELELNGQAQNYSAGWTFEVDIERLGTVVHTKTTNITGTADSHIVVGWLEVDTDRAEAEYLAVLKGTRTSDGRRFELAIQLFIT